MPAQQGEVALSTLFADVHYVFSPPHVKPPHHRFDKTCYVYLYHNPIQRRGRLEVANYAGTPEQDAFVGYLDMVRIERSHKHPTLFTIVVDGLTPQNGSAGSTPQTDLSQWHLPAPDQRGEGRYTYRLHTVEMYFWTVDDSEMFLDSLKRVVHESQLRLLDAPQQQQVPYQQQQQAQVADHRQSTVSPVVQKLEQVAISKPYQGQGRPDSISTTHSFPGPPTAPTPSNPHTTSSPPPVEAPANYAPMAYNPAAPAAPEPIAHREPTPPPPEAEHGTGLTAAVAQDHGNQYAPPHLQHQGSFPQQTGQQPYMPGPPPPQQQGVGSFSPPPSGTPVGIQRTNTTNSFPPPPPQAQSFAPPPNQPQNTGTPPQGMHQQQQPYGGYHSQQLSNYPGSPGHPPVQSPGFQPVQSPGFPPIQSPGFPPVPGNKPPSHSPSQPPTPGYAPQPSPGMPPGGYTQYNYAQNMSSSDPYAVHQQAYRPTENEAAHHKPPAQAGQKPGRFETGAKKFEKGVGGFLKKLDKKF
ncbi:hypothetical protein EJ05DRAFT_488058 [Pseudovirgaria hyperparasitica]|uniref:Uncharacterized protein n=1 Tax=Pseudovirgaria hyperparasitica TaxID=470096 RepID=A0A6A6W024_9PEZI|nr:uncharacterized protein EJ05DRAFT_488058 [Pseudovirgaria hyperparasitica]KAF2756278.1 hypothetical protein EJ05DRAFT_488058 [Pseudovirgaria hyperparasitica]